MRLGDAFIEAEDFPGAMAEYKAAIEALNGHVKPSDRRITSAFLAMGMVRWDLTGHGARGRGNGLTAATPTSADVHARGLLEGRARGRAAAQGSARAGVAAEGGQLQA